MVLIEKIKNMELSEQELKEIQFYINMKLYEIDPKLIYKKYYYEKRSKDVKEKIKIGYRIREYLKFKSMIDFGCGLGGYLQGAYKGGARIKGIDIGVPICKIKRLIPREMQEFFEYGNIGESLNYGLWESVWSIEVGEHLLESQVDTYIKNLTKATALWLIVSMATKEGYSHFFLRNKDYWINRITQQDKALVFSAKKTKQVKEIWGKKAPDNLLVFKRDLKIDKKKVYSHEPI